jgi:hypothetical protein
VEPGAPADAGFMCRSPVTSHVSRHSSDILLAGRRGADPPRDAGFAKCRPTRAVDRFAASWEIVCSVRAADHECFAVSVNPPAAQLASGSRWCSPAGDRVELVAAYRQRLRRAVGGEPASFGRRMSSVWSARCPTVSLLVLETTGMQARRWAGPCSTRTIQVTDEIQEDERIRRGSDPIKHVTAQEMSSLCIRKCTVGGDHDEPVGATPRAGAAPTMGADDGVVD